MLDNRDCGEWKQFSKGWDAARDTGWMMGNLLNFNAARAVTIWALASLMTACMEPDWPGLEPDRDKKDTVPPGIRIILPDSAENTYTIDIVINTGKSGE